MKILVTGSAGFIGFHTSKRLLDSGYDVIGLDNLNNYYDINLKKDRLKILQEYDRFAFHKIDLKDQGEVESLFKKESPQRVIHMAAQAGVRYSIEHPQVYIQSNIVGTFNILEGCRHNQVEHLVYASSSSVYGLNTKYPFSVHDKSSHPVSFMGLPKFPMNSWLTLILTSTNYQRQDYVFLRFMDHGVDRIWLISSSQNLFWLQSRLIYITKVI